MKRHPIIAVTDDLVICGGPQLTAPQHQPTAAQSETHQLLRPVFHLGEIVFSGEPGAVVPVRCGDVIEERDDGKRYHCPRPEGQQRPER